MDTSEQPAPEHVHVIYQLAGKHRETSLEEYPSSSSSSSSSPSPSSRRTESKVSGVRGPSTEATVVRVTANRSRNARNARTLPEETLSAKAVNVSVYDASHPVIVSFAFTLGIVDVRAPRGSLRGKLRGKRYRATVSSTIVHPAISQNSQPLFYS
ncbi:uncharacterized protein LOC143149465 [Ptiloglossa arizonensis]|uniref:uncharacterized protein LOC143149465 n=1 Tax=Ptiloglossa arizonensis TaxID=3350558 RepID=UPI003FA149BF